MELCVARHIVVVLGLSVVPGGRKGGELQGGGGSMMRIWGGKYPESNILKGQGV